MALFPFTELSLLLRLLSLACTAFSTTSALSRPFDHCMLLENTVQIRNLSNLEIISKPICWVFVLVCSD